MSDRRKALYWLVVCLLLGAGAGFATWGYTRGMADPAPLGVPLPEVQPLYEVLLAGNKEDISLVERRIPEVMLELLTAQPDGSPPLRYTINCEVADFIIRHPYGAQTISFPIEDVEEDRTLIEAIFQFDQPLQMLKYTVENRREGESVAGYCARLHDELAGDSVEFYPDTTPFTVDGYRFEHFEYRRRSEDGSELAHSIYVGALGPHRALVMNFITVPELHLQAQPGVLKILGSFVPGWQLLDLNQAELEAFSSVVQGNVDGS